jgi:hypothetical protein
VVTFLLDTNVLSEARRGGRAHPSVRAWWDATPDDAMYTSVLVLGEVRRGIESLRRRDAPAAMVLEQWALRLAESFGHRVLPVDVRIAERWGRLSVPNPLPAVDGLLAATALVHGLTVVTRNLRHIERTGCPVLDPFAG